MKIISQLLFGLVLGALGITFSITLMLHFGTPPATAFAYLLFFTTLRSITTVTLTRARAIELLAAAILCIAASFWTLRSTQPLAWDSQFASPCSIAWRSALILLCLLALPQVASHLAARSIKPLRRLIS